MWYYHENVKHQGRHFTEGVIRSAGYWITGGKKLISSLIYKCVKCRKLRGKRDTSAKHLTHDVLVTLMAEVCAIINGRPIVPVSSDSENPLVLTPSTLLTHKTDHISDVGITCDLKDLYRSEWKRVQILADTFWSRWKREFLTTLQVRRKWPNSRPNIKKGDIILLKEPNVGRNEWPTGIVLETIPSGDNMIRKAVVCISKDGRTTKYIRPVTEMIVLLNNTD